MTARAAAAKMGPGEPTFDEQAARLIGSLASQPRKPVKRAPAAKVTAMGKMAAARAQARTNKKKPK